MTAVRLRVWEMGLCLRQCIHFARKRGILPRRSAAGSGPLVARHRQVHAPCEAETGHGHKRRSPKQAHRCGVLRYKRASRTRLAQRGGPFKACPEPVEGPDFGLSGMLLSGSVIDAGLENRERSVYPWVSSSLGFFATFLWI